MQISAIILAGGKSKRMGADKALLEIDGVSLIEKSILLCKNFCNDIIISSNNEKHAKYGFPIIADEVDNCGPIGGIATCLKHSKTNWNFVISVDAAFVEKEFLTFLISETGACDLIVPKHNKGKEPLIALYNKSCLPVMQENLKAGDYKMHNLISAVNTTFIDSNKWIEKFPKLFHNLNRPEDL